MGSLHRNCRMVTWTLFTLAVLISMAASESSVLKLNLNFDLTRGKNGLQLRVHEPEDIGFRGKRSGEKKSIKADSFEDDNANESNKDSGVKDDEKSPKHALRSKSEESSEEDENRGVTHALDARDYEPKEPERTRDKEEEDDNNSNNSNKSE